MTNPRTPQALPDRGDTVTFSGAGTVVYSDRFARPASVRLRLDGTYGTVYVDIPAFMVKPFDPQTSPDQE